MANNYKFPGVYPEIRDFSGVVADNTVTSAAYVGEAAYGPVFEPTLISTLQDFTDRFGPLSSKYGYAGYSLAVAAETISQHYFVRVVPTGDSESHTDDDASWAAARFMIKDYTSEVEPSEGYWYEEIKAAITARDSGQDAGMFEEGDVESAFMVVANDPNNRKFYISIADSTINENRAYPVSAPTVLTAFDESGEAATMVTVTVPAAVADGMEIGDSINVARMTNSALNGVFKVYDWSYADVSKTTVKISYIVPSAEETAGDANARIGKYPYDDETTFSLTVYEKIGRVMSALETYEYCTLYPAQDQYGNSIFLEDVINNSSKYIQVFVNRNFEKDDLIAIPANINYVELTGGQSGTFKDAGEKYKALNSAWDLFKDRTQVTVSLLMNSGYVLKGNVSYQAKMLEIAEHRRDCFCLFDCPMTETDYENLSDWRKNIQAFNSYRGAVSAPWIKTYDSVQGRANFVMCPSAYVAKIMGAYDPWMAPAGLNRGVLSAATVSPTGLTQYYDTTVGGNLYTDNQINLVVKDNAVGYVNWGQRTLQQRPSALDRINVARTVIYIETVLRDAARYHLFENNTAFERNQITLQFNAFLDTVLSQEGIQRYQVVCDSSNNTPQVIANNQLVIDIYLWPTYTVEVIKITSTVMGADVTTSIATV